MPQILRCAACRSPLPETARHNQRFCTTRCRERARKRVRRGGPEADPSPQGTVIGTDPLVAKLDRQLAGKQRTIARLRARHQADRDRVRAAEVVAAAADRRAERAIASMGRDQHALSRENAELADALRKARQDLQIEKWNNAQLREVIGMFRADAERRELAERKVSTQIIRRQWEALVVRIARQASSSTGLPLTGLDQEVVSTWQRLRQPPRMPQKQAAPRRRNR